LVDLSVLQIADGTFRLVRIAANFRVEIVSSTVSEVEEVLDNHFVSGESTSLIGTNDGGTTEGFNTWQFTDNSFFSSHSTSSQGEACSDDSRKSFWNSSNGQSDSDLEVVESSRDETTVSFIAKVSEVHDPDKNTDNTNSSGKSLTEFV